MGLRVNIGLDSASDQGHVERKPIFAGKYCRYPKKLEYCDVSFCPGSAVDFKNFGILCGKGKQKWK